MPNQIIEGTWEEILQYAPQLTGQTVRLTILTPPSQPPLTLAQTLKGRVGEVSLEPAPQMAWGDLVQALAGAWSDDLPDLANIRTGSGQDIVRESL
jgi:hypothetical protein